MVLLNQCWPFVLNFEVASSSKHPQKLKIRQKLQNLTFQFSCQKFKSISPDFDLDNSKIFQRS